jgi:hypothetical protein
MRLAYAPTFSIAFIYYLQIDDLCKDKYFMGKNYKNISSDIFIIVVLF